MTIPSSFTTAGDAERTAATGAGAGEAAPLGERVPIEVKIRDGRILILDDRIANVTLLENVLRRLGYRQIRGITDSREVFDEVRTWNPDLLVLDLAMPHVNGFEVMEFLQKERTRDEAIPVLVLTADTDPLAKRRALAAGATEFVAKPFDSSEILIRIRNMLVMHTLRKELRNQNRRLEEKVAERTKKLSDRTAELEDALARLQRSQQQVLQQERLRAFSAMAGGVAHDFNNVLNCVVGYTDLMLSQPDALDDRAGALECLQAMNTAAHDGARIVSRLRNFYRSREETEVFTRTEAKPLLEEVVAITQPRWKNQALSIGRTIGVHVEVAGEPWVSCNATELREALVNLVFNAVDAMADGGKITLRARASADRVSLGVSDTGAGMTDEVRERCLDPFFSTKGDGGTGLGLAMVFGIAKRHGGTVEIESSPGNGTTVWMHLYAGAEQVDEMDHAELLPPRALHILAADDDPICRDVLFRLLDADGHSVVGVADGVEAMHRFKAERFDLVILDQAMPRLTGTNVAEAIKRAENAPPVILITGSTDDTFAEHDESLVVRKPIAHENLRRVILRALTLCPTS